MRTQRVPHLSRSSGGFTLFEMLVASAIFLLVLFAVFMLYDVGVAQYSRSTRKGDIQSQARAAIERMAREIRQAGYNGANPATNRFVIATDDTISFHGDVGDGSGLQYITYSLRGDCTATKTTSLYRNASATSTTTYCGGQPMIDSVADLRFTYFAVGNVPIPLGGTPPYTPTPPYQLDNQNYATGTSVPTTTPTVDRDNIRQVRISLTLQEMAGTVIVPYTISTDVAIRNIP